MGRCKYDEFSADCLPYSLIEAIATNVCEVMRIDASIYDWNALKIKVKQSNKAQRRRFADTILKLQKYVAGNRANILEFVQEDGSNFCMSVDECNWRMGEETVKRWITNKKADIGTENRHYYTFKKNKEIIPHYVLNVSEFAAVTGRNEKTVRDWLRKEFIISYPLLSNYSTYILVEGTIKKLEIFKGKSHYK